MKRNNAIPNNHFKKTNQPIKSWFSQPLKAAQRKKLRDSKAKKCAPRPSSRLYPIVRCSTIKNKKERLGKGFSLSELKAVDLNENYAKTIGIAVDTRRWTKNQEAFDKNVQRLKEYVSKLTFFGSYGEARAAGAEQYRGVIMPIEKKAIEISTITAEELAKL